MSGQDDDFFNLTQPYEEISASEEFWDKAASSGGEISNYLYRPDSLASPQPPKKWLVRDKVFKNISFSKTHLSHLEFADCRFERCLFIGSTITDCRFGGCSFINSNFFRAQIEGCFVDPKAFAECLNPKHHQNIGVSLYQELLHNSRQQAQPEFAREAQYQFLRWKRYLAWDELSDSDRPRLGKLWGYFSLFPS